MELTCCPEATRPRRRAVLKMTHIHPLNTRTTDWRIRRWLSLVANKITVLCFKCAALLLFWGQFDLAVWFLWTEIRLFLKNKLKEM